MQREFVAYYHYLFGYGHLMYLTEQQQLIIKKVNNEQA